MQAGKHEAIVKNVHELLAKLAWDFSPQQLDHLFECFQVWQQQQQQQWSFLWSPYVIGQTIIFSSCFFLSSSSFFPRLISAVGDWMFTMLWHMVWP